MVVLLYSGDCLIRGVLSIAHRANLSPLLVSAGCVGAATTAPELFVALDGAASGRAGLAHGVIVGSGVANLLLVLPVCLLIRPAPTAGRFVRSLLVVSAAAVIGFLVVTGRFGLGPLIGIGLLLSLAALAGLLLLMPREDQSRDTADDLRLSGQPRWKTSLLLGAGAIGLPLGSALLVESGINLADRLTLPEEFVGLAILAAGAALPELGAGLAASLRRQDDVVIGSVLGACLFNVCLVGGAVGLLGWQGVSSEYTRYGYWVLGAASAGIAALGLFGPRLGRVAAVGALLAYGLYIVGLIAGSDVGELRFMIFERPTVATTLP
jgi:cation:H+ antiporter